MTFYSIEILRNKNPTEMDSTVLSQYPLVPNSAVPLRDRRSASMWWLAGLGKKERYQGLEKMWLACSCCWRHVDEHVLPDCVTFVAAINRRSENAAMSDVLNPVTSRYRTSARCSNQTTFTVARSPAW
jgi:hypothetical protein